MAADPLQDARSETPAAPLVSVICTARNASATIARTIESVRRQTLADWEMIIVDDGSTDATVEVVQGYAKGDPRIRLIPTPGVGRGRALNLALAQARAEFVANLDADDETHPQRLAMQLAAFARFASPVVLSTDVLFVGEEQRAHWGAGQLSIERSRLIDVTRLLAARNPVAHSSIMARRRDLRRAGGYAEDLPSQFDYELWVRMVEQGCRIVQLDVPLTVMRSHAAQSFQRRRRWAYLRNSIRVQRRAIAACGASRFAYALILARFAFGMLPLALRRTLQSGFTALAPRPDPAARDSKRGPRKPELPAALEQPFERSAGRVDLQG